MLRVSTPARAPKPALLPRRTPSTSTAVPKAALPAVLPPWRREKLVAVVRSGFMVLPPGSRADTSEREDICRWLSASRPRVVVVLRPVFALSAVTVTSSIARELIFREKSSLMSLSSSSISTLLAT